MQRDLRSVRVSSPGRLAESAASTAGRQSVISSRPKIIGEAWRPRTVRALLTAASPRGRSPQRRSRPQYDKGS